MPKFPSLEWCESLVAVLTDEPSVGAVVREWGGRSIGVVIGRDAGLERDFCVFARPHAAEPRLLELTLCEDEDDLELESPDYLFRAPLGTIRQLISGKVEPLEILRRGQVKVEGDLEFLITFGTRHQKLGQAAVARVDTVY